MLCSLESSEGRGRYRQRGRCARPRRRGRARRGPSSARSGGRDRPAAAGAITCAPLFWSLPTAFLAGTGAAAGIALINSVGNLAGLVSPVSCRLPQRSDRRDEVGMYALAAILVLGAILVLTTPPKLVNR